MIGRRHGRRWVSVGLCAAALTACAGSQVPASTTPTAAPTTPVAAAGSTTVGAAAATTVVAATPTTVVAESPTTMAATAAASTTLPATAMTPPSTSAADRLSAAQLQAVTDAIPASLQVPGAVVAVSVRGEIWVGASGIENTATGEPMRSDRRFRAASITKLFTAQVILGMVERGELGIDETIATWFPTFSNADRITIRMLLSHTSGVTTDWWLEPEILELATADLAREWNPAEIVDLMAKRTPAGEPGGPIHYSNVNYILLGEIAAAVGGVPIGTLIDKQILTPLRLDHTTYQADNAPDLAHAYNSFTGQTLDVGALDLRSFTSMAGAAGSMQTDVSDLVRYVRELFRPNGLLSANTISTMTQATPLSGRHGMATMGFCPCVSTDAGRTYGGWGHTGSIPGFFSATAYFAASDTAVAVFVNSDTVDAHLIADDALDPIIEQLIAAITVRR